MPEQKYTQINEYLFAVMQKTIKKDLKIITCDCGFSNMIQKLSEP